jgi:predicted 3-demethylubiquinone-9 3-methyltransferase (glyoxalase superfamily)
MKTWKNQKTKCKRMTNKITPCLWFDNEAEDAATFYVSDFKNSKIGDINRYGKEGFEFHGKPEGTAMTVTFTINGQDFTALNGGPQFKFSEAISFEVFCETQEEIDHYWNKLTEEGSEGQCGWLKDKFGLSWQIVPAILPRLMKDPLKATRVTKAFLQIKKLEYTNY